MAKPSVAAPRKTGKKPRSRGPLLVMTLVGFVLLAIGVNLRRVYGFSEAKKISRMEQEREALISEQQKLGDAIRVASDRKHIIDIAESRLNMRMPDLSQVIDLPRRPLIRRDTIKP